MADFGVARQLAAGPAQRSRLFYLMSHVSERRDRILEDILRPHGLTLLQWRVLLGLGWLKVRTMNEVADFLAMDRTSLTRTIDKLCERGLAERAEVAHDRRLTEASLTGEGLALRGELVAAVLEMGERLTVAIDPDDLAAAERVAEQLLERLVGHRAGARRITEVI